MSLDNWSSGVPNMLAGAGAPEINPDQSGRLELAQWITGEENTLTARVWANRIWLHLMGRPLVETPDNFGVSGQSPHPELLDKLATRLVELDWNTDALIREIVLSRTWGCRTTTNPTPMPKILKTSCIGARHLEGCRRVHPRQHVDGFW